MAALQVQHLLDCILQPARQNQEVSDRANRTRSCVVGVTAAAQKPLPLIS